MVRKIVIGVLIAVLSVGIVPAFSASASAQVPDDLPVPIPPLPALPEIPELPSEAAPVATAVSPAPWYACATAPTLLGAVLLLAGFAGVEVADVWPVVSIAAGAGCAVFPAPPARVQCAPDRDIDAQYDDVFVLVWESTPPEFPKGIMFSLRPHTPLGAAANFTYSIDAALAMVAGENPGVGPTVGEQLGCVPQ